MSLRDQILQVEDLQKTEVEVPEWNTKVTVRSLLASERDEFENMFINEGMKNVRAFLAVRTIVDENGERVFRDTDAPELGKKNAKALDRICDAARKLSGLSDEDIKELEKN